MQKAKQIAAQNRHRHLSGIAGGFSQSAIDSAFQLSTELSGGRSVANGIRLLREAMELFIAEQSPRESEATVELKKKIDVKTNTIAAERARSKPDARQLENLRTDLRLLHEEKEKIELSHQEIREEVLPLHVQLAVASETGKSAQDLAKGKMERVEGLERDFDQHVQGQDHVKREVLKRYFAWASEDDVTERPIGVLFFAGPSGVGKTLIAQTIAKVVHGSEAVIIDMGDFHDRSTANRLIGAAPGYIGFEQGGQLTDPVRKDPHLVILIDEIEKADLSVLLTYFALFDRGELIDAQGRRVKYKDCTIIITSNLGLAALRENDGTQPLRKLLDLVGLPKTTKPYFTISETNGVFDRVGLMKAAMQAHGMKEEFINRLDAILVFNDLTPEQLEGVVRIDFEKTLGEGLRRKGIKATLTLEAIKGALAVVSTESGGRGVSKSVKDSILRSFIVSTTRDRDLNRQLTENGNLEIGYLPEEGALEITTEAEGCKVSMAKFYLAQRRFEKNNP